MKENMPPISELYYKYKNTTDEKIREFLSKVKIVIDTDKGIGTMRGYYPLSKKSMNLLYCLAGFPSTPALNIEVRRWI